ncbi:MAG: MBOAT family protein [Eubacterium sp.]|nr:MBOAT family protein [Eubacterium sp.]
MSITSASFFIMLILSVGIYYLLPRACRWYALLAYSVYFFCASSMPVTGLYLFISVIATWGCAVLISRHREENHKKALAALLLGIMTNIGVLSVLKYSNFFIQNMNAILSWGGVLFHFEEVNLLAPMGISFYTLMAVGYLTDVYWGTVEPQGNILKTALFIGYYPQLISGPITRYHEMKEQLYAGHAFRYRNVAFGAQRILYGMFKKIVISSRAEILVNAIYADVETYDGLYLWIAMFLFMLQLYTDFSGCMDIIMGASECYGIILPENFSTPFASATVQEYWQRWHATLGAWLKDYILYPILRTRLWQRMAKWIKSHIGKKASKQIPSYLGMLCVWLLIGLWHGGRWKFVIGMGLWFWGCIVFESATEPYCKRLKNWLGIDEDTDTWRIFQSVKVFVLVAIGNVFFRIDSLPSALYVLKRAVSHMNPWIFFDGSLAQMGITYGDMNILIIGTVALCVVGHLQRKHGSAREWIQKQFLPFRWFLWLTMFAFILVYGTYGPDYDAASFIYGGF